MPKKEPKNKKVAEEKSSDYGAKDIFVLEGLDPVRKRPGMYIGSTGPDGLHHLIWEIVDNSIDEAMAGYAKNIEIILLPKNRVQVSDDGRGIPVDTHKQTKKSALETIMTTLHAGGKFGGGAYKVSGGLHGVGASVVNALSVWMRVEVCKEGGLYVQEYQRGKPKAAVKKIGTCGANSTTVTFEPDQEIFKEIEEYNWKRVLDRLRQQSYLTRGIRMTLRDERKDTPTSGQGYGFYFEGGIASFVKYLNRDLTAVHDTIFYAAKTVNDIQIELALQYADDLQAREMGFANNIYTQEGGMHITGFRTALTRVLNDYARKNSYLKQDEENLIGEDVREGLTAIVSLRLKETQFEGQTKSKLGNPEARTAVESFFAEAFGAYLEENPADARAIAGKVILAAKARKAAKAAKDTILRKGILDGMTLPGKLADCQSKSAEESELFLVEGDSAGGCFSGDTKIALTDGRAITFQELVEECQQGKKNYCYTIAENGSIAVGDITNPRVTKKNTKVVKVVLDNREEITCTPEHKFMLHDGTFKEAQHLTQHDSLMPLYRKYSEIAGNITIRGYEMIFDPSKHRWIFTHILSDVYNLLRGIYAEVQGPHRHHQDFNKINNNPDNLVRLSREEHLETHRRLVKYTLHRPDVLEKVRELHKTPEFREKIRKAMTTPKMHKLLSVRAKKQWENAEYKKFMIEKFLDFYQKNESYREVSQKILAQAQEAYWSSEENRQEQAKRVREHFKNNPERKVWLADIAQKQWDNKKLRMWRSEKTKEQWTPKFRMQRKVAYNKTYYEHSVGALYEIYRTRGSVDSQEYETRRKKTQNKNLLKYDTILDRFFAGDTRELTTAIQNYNHRIKSVMRLEKKIDVYDIEVPGTHNFALASGVFVHNSAKGARDRRIQAILPLRGKILNVERARLDKMLASKEIKALVIALGAAIADEFNLEKIRYHKIVIMTDADVDGAHIRTLLLTLFYRYYRPVVEAGYLYIAQPPLYKISKGREFRYAYTEAEKEKVLEEMQHVREEKKKVGKGTTKIMVEEDESKDAKEDEVITSEEGIGEMYKGFNIQRYKGLGEMNPDQLWETTMDPARRVLLQVTVRDAQEADHIFDILMGDEVAPRKSFIQTHAKAVKNLDI
ncbi:MAG: DNA gyrase subunit B [Parcubacteria group bacterium Gr01-1014_29]|nr:MAG: DNA gyrase subunit B [Parcubacteria group bacterium Gr01-1014_29]